jgi:hypothetical protein
MKNAKKIISAIAIGSALFYMSGSVAKDAVEVDLGATIPMVSAETDLFSAEANMVDNFQSLSVRVVSQDGNVVFEQRTKAGSIGFFFSDLNLADGKYFFEVKTFHADYSGRSESGGYSRAKSGSFIITNGYNQPRFDPETEQDVSFLEQASPLTRLAGAVLEFIVPSAQAANITTAPDGDMLMEDDSPWFNVYNNPDTASSTGRVEHWRWYYYDRDTAGTATQGLELYDPVNAITILDIEPGASADHALTIESTGDLSFGGGDFYMNKSGSEPTMTIGGGIQSNHGLEIISDNCPEVFLFDTFVGPSGVEMEVCTNGLSINMDTDGSGTADVSDVVNFQLGAPSGSLVVADGGNVGFGTFTPESNVHVVDGGASATRTLFHLENSGRTHFKIENTEFGSEWVFTNAGGNFFISLQGTGGPEFNILSNGNAVLAGTLTQNSDFYNKTAITHVNNHEILDLVSALPVTKWEYKDARGEAHIGPMAQDFYAAFGLGKNDKGLSSIDTGGVALAAIKALNEENKALKASNVALTERLEKLESQQSTIQAMMATLIEAQQASPVLTKTAMN